jgi:hypothetical protein
MSSLITIINFTQIALTLSKNPLELLRWWRSKKWKWKKISSMTKRRAIFVLQERSHDNRMSRFCRRWKILIFRFLIRHLLRRFIWNRRCCSPNLAFQFDSLTEWWEQNEIQTPSRPPPLSQLSISKGMIYEAPDVNKLKKY